MAMPTPGKNEWSTHLCNCCAPPGDMRTCLFATFCPACQYGRNLDKMPANVCCGSNGTGAATAYCLLCIVASPWIVHMSSRRWIREKYSIPGKKGRECMKVCFCFPCALTQEARELEIRGVRPAGAAQVPSSAPHAAHPPPHTMAPPHQAMAPPPQAMYNGPPAGYPPVGYPPVPAGGGPHAPPQQPSQPPPAGFLARQ